MLIVVVVVVVVVVAAAAAAAAAGGSGVKLLIYTFHEDGTLGVERGDKTWITACHQ